MKKVKHIDPSWFCLRTQPKHEHIAAAQLAAEGSLEVYFPRIRFKRATRRGPVWFTEALFPSYLFARLEFAACLRRIHHARGVQGVVHFGDCWPTVPEAVIAELRAAIGDTQVHVVEDNLRAGDPVLISGGVLDGLRAVVTRVMTARARVAVLLEFLGRQTTVEIPQNALVAQEKLRAVLPLSPLCTAAADRNGPPRMAGPIRADRCS